MLAWGCSLSLARGSVPDRSSPEGRTRGANGLLTALDRLAGGRNDAGMMQPGRHRQGECHRGDSDRAPQDIETRLKRKYCTVSSPEAEILVRGKRTAGQPRGREAFSTVLE